MTAKSLAASGDGSSPPAMLLPGQFNVSASGAATYAVPISVPPGTAGMVPSLSLAYASGSGDGILGLGGTLSGLPSIERCPRTTAQDTLHGGVNYDINDRFCLGGQRLMVITGTYGANNSEYRTEIESFTKVVAHGTAGNGPGWFEVHTKSGQTLEFGNTADSQWLAVGKTTARAWGVNKISDTKGNYLTVTYTDDTTNGQAYPTRIDYTGNTGLSPYNSVRFTYNTSRPDVTPTYQAGSLQQTTVLLTNVKTYAGANVVTDYQITYELGTSLRDSRITSIKQCDAAGACLAPTTFGWQGSRDTLTLTATAQSFTQGTSGPVPGHFNTDGLTDMLLYTATCPGGGQIKSGSQSGTSFPSANLTATYDYYAFHATTPTAYNGPACFQNANSVPGDINADGLNDLALEIITWQYSGGWIQVPTSEVLRTDPYGSLNQVTADGQFGYPFFLRTGSFAQFTVDFNGDGRADGFLPGTGTTGYAYLSDGNGAFTQDGGHAGLGTGVTYMPGDFDGDGCSDMLAQGTTKAIVYFCQPAVAQYTLPNWAGFTLVLGDYNGDGKADVLVVKPSQTGQLWLSTGTTLVQTSFSVPSTWSNYAVVTGDWNGDHKTDVALISHTSGQAHLIFLSTGTGFTQVTTIANTDTTTTGIVADWNSDGADDLWIQKPSGDTEYTFSYVPELLTTVNNGIGATTTATFDRLNKNGTFYSIVGAPAVYPGRFVNGPIYVVSRVDVSNGIGGTYGTTWNYKGAGADVVGRGSLGFRTVIATDLQTGIVQTTSYRQDYPLIGRVSSQTTVSGAITLNTTTNTFQSTSQGGTRYRVTLKKQVIDRTDLDGSAYPTVTVNYTYDTYDNPLTITQTLPDGSSSKITNAFTNDTVHWILGERTSSDFRNIVGASDITRHFTYGRDATSGLLTQIVIEPSFPTLKLQADFGLDAFGNRTGVTLSGQSIVTRTTNAAYETNGRFPTSVTNALNQATGVGFNANFGTLANQTDPNNIATAWSYDTYGRRTLETRPDGNKSGVAYLYCSGVNGGTASCPTYGAYGVKVTPLASNGTTQNGAVSWIYFDALNRVIANDAQGFDGSSWIRVATQYDALGRVQKTSRPYFIGAAQKWTTYSYDTLGRVTLATFPDNSDTGFAFHGLTTSVTNDKNQTTTTVRNNQGRVATVTDAANKTTTYAYDSFGDVLSVADPASNSIVNTYDARGRKLTSSDPDMGGWQYGYDVLNEVISQTDAASQTSTIAYDKLGRVTSRAEPDLTSTYVYDLASQGIGRLYSATGSNGYARVQSYDAFGRPAQVQITVPGANGGNPYTIADGYDANGRLATIGYPSGFTAQYAYTALGYLSALKDNATGQVFWMANTLDAEMHLLTQTAGNGVMTAQSFDANTGRIASVQAGAANAIANYSFGFDTIGNLTSRSDLNQTLSETFGYDNRNRLTSYQVNTDPAKTVSYDDLGNITVKSDVGTYTYPAAGQSRPHAVSTIAGAINASFTYDSNGNMTSDSSRTLTWTSYNMVSSIGQGAASVTYVYDCEHQRIAQTSMDGTTVYLRDPASGITIEQFTGAGGPQWNEYLYAAGRIVAARFAFGTGDTILRYFIADHLGSTAVLTDEGGATSETNSYDAWGKRRFANGADDPTGSIVSQTTRGFTGQEHIASMGLINYNARLYNPTFGKFASADSVVSNPFRGQHFNRYSYVLNNPLSFVDPSGHMCSSPTPAPDDAGCSETVDVWGLKLPYWWCPNGCGGTGLGGNEPTGLTGDSGGGGGGDGDGSHSGNNDPCAGGDPNANECVVVTANRLPSLSLALFLNGLFGVGPAEAGEGTPNDKKNDKCDQSLMDLGNSIRDTAYAGNVAGVGLTTAGIPMAGFAAATGNPVSLTPGLTMADAGILFVGASGYVDLVGSGIQSYAGAGPGPYFKSLGNVALGFGVGSASGLLGPVGSVLAGGTYNSFSLLASGPPQHIQCH